VAKTVEIEFTRKYVKDAEQEPDQLFFVLRNPFELLVEMQMKQAAKAAIESRQSLFKTQAWDAFATSGIKAWFAHTKSWICSGVAKLDVIHYEDMTENFEHGISIFFNF
jgi:hypothetical protein